MRRIALLILLWIPIGVLGQNLVPNWSFEDTLSCPDNLTQIDRVIGWSSFSLTPDYFNTCSSNVVSIPVSVPHNIWGDQSAHTGNAYAGFVAFKAGTANAREFIGTQLSQQLIIGQKYFLSFWISSAFGYILNQFPSSACNNIGAKLSTLAYSQSNPQLTNNYAQLIDTNIINDTINWVRISGSFIADSNYTFLSIGNFFDDTHTSFTNMGTTAANDAYYYLDDVKLSTDSNFVSGINEQITEDFVKIYPNPAKDLILIEGIDINSIAIFNLCGQIVNEKNIISAFKTVVDISDLNDGVYIIKITKSNRELIDKIIHIK